MATGEGGGGEYFVNTWLLIKLHHAVRLPKLVQLVRNSETWLTVRTETLLSFILSSLRPYGGHPKTLTNFRPYCARF
jgi:hypothetical protein